jgi:hypothetical protein
MSRLPNPNSESARSTRKSLLNGIGVGSFSEFEEYGNPLLRGHLSAGESLRPDLLPPEWGDVESGRHLGMLQIQVVFCDWDVDGDRVGR